MQYIGVTVHVFRLFRVILHNGIFFIPKLVFDIGHLIPGRRHIVSTFQGNADMLPTAAIAGNLS